MISPFRHVEGSVSDSVSQWPYEALVAAIERGTLGDWQPILTELRANPWGTVSRQITDYLGYEKPYGVGPLLARTIAQARADAAERERAEIACRIRTLIEQSGLTQEQFARAVGTSRSRLSTYAQGRVVPSATMMLRMEQQFSQEPN